MDPFVQSGLFPRSADNDPLHLLIISVKIRCWDVPQVELNMLSKAAIAIISTYYWIEIPAPLLPHFRSLLPLWYVHVLFLDPRPRGGRYTHTQLCVRSWTKLSRERWVDRRIESKIQIVALVRRFTVCSRNVRRCVAAGGLSSRGLVDREVARFTTRLFLEVTS